QSRVVATLCAYKLCAARWDRKSSRGNLLAHVFCEQFPSVGNSSAHDYLLRVQNVYKACQTSAQILPHATEDFQRKLVALYTAAINILGSQLFARMKRRVRVARRCLARHTRDCRCRSVNFQTLTAATGAGHTAERFHA